MPDTQRGSPELQLRWLGPSDAPLPLLRSPQDAPTFVQALDGALAQHDRQNKLLLPNLHKHVDTIAIFSDYGGDHGSYQTYSFLVVGWDALAKCLEGFKAVRTKHGLSSPYKEIAYKTMAYGPQHRALEDFLSAAELAPGLLFTLIVEDRVRSIVADNNKKSHDRFVDLLAEAGLGEWKGAVAERLLRIVHCVAYLAAVLGREDHKLFWMTDHDAIAANENKTAALGTLLGRILQLYSTVEFKSVGYGTPFKRVDEAEPDLADLLSIADLAAGAVAELYTASANSDDPQTKEDTNKILLWLSHQGIGLKKLNFVVRQAQSGDVETAIASFGRKDEGQDVTLIVTVRPRAS